MILNPYVFRQALESDFIALVYDDGQSNSAGRAEADRLALMTYPDAPSQVYIYYKPNYTNTDNGAFQAILAGSNTTEPDVTSFRIFGAFHMAAIKFQHLLNRPVYIVMGGDGGTALKQNLTSPDWSPASSGECFDTFYTYYLEVAIGKLVAANPGKQIVVFPSRHQGETDAFVANNPATTDFVNTNYPAFDTARQTKIAAIIAAYPTVVFAPTAMRNLNYLQTSNETTINSYYASLVSANPSRYFLIDTTGQKRNVDLTSGEKGGIVATNTDDEHLSHLAMDYIATQEYNYWKNLYSIPGDDSIITSNTGYDPSTFNANYVRLQMNSANTTTGTNNEITALTNNLSGVAFTSVGDVRFKINKRKGAYFFQQFTPGARIESNSAVGSTYFSSSFSWSAWVKPRDGQPGAAYYFIHDIASTASPNNSRFYVLLDTTGKINVAYAVGGTAVQGITNTAVFTNAQQIDETHLAVTVTSGGLIRIYVNGVLQTLDAVNNGNIAALTMALYTNITNKIQIGARRSGVSTYADFLFGIMREWTLQPGVYSSTEIANLQLN